MMLKSTNTRFIGRHDAISSLSLYVRFPDQFLYPYCLNICHSPVWFPNPTVLLERALFLDINLNLILHSWD